MKRYRFDALISAALLAAFPALAHAQVIVPGRCHMGSCFEMLSASKQAIRSNRVGTLYEVKVSSRSWSMGSPRPSAAKVPFARSEISYVICSTSKPAYIFKASAGSSSNYLAHRLNPDGQSNYGYNMSAYSIYWATCHNLVKHVYFSSTMVTQSIRLGYPGKLIQDQIEINHPLELMR